MSAHSLQHGRWRVQRNHNPRLPLCNPFTTLKGRCQLRLKSVSVALRGQPPVHPSQRGAPGDALHRLPPDYREAAAWSRAILPGLANYSLKTAGGRVHPSGLSGCHSVLVPAPQPLGQQRTAGDRAPHGARCVSKGLAGCSDRPAVPSAESCKCQRFSHWPWILRCVWSRPSPH